MVECLCHLDSSKIDFAVLIADFEIKALIFGYMLLIKFILHKTRFVALPARIITSIYSNTVTTVEAVTLPMHYVKKR